MTKTQWLATVMLVALASNTQAADPVETGVKLISQKNASDQIVISKGKEGLVVLVTNASGIGELTLERAGDNWPVQMTVVLQYAAGQPFTKIENFTVHAGGPVGATIKGGTVTFDGPKELKGADGKMVISWVDYYR